MGSDWLEEDRKRKTVGGRTWTQDRKEENGHLDTRHDDVMTIVEQ